MFRAALLSIVLTLAAGQNAALFCAVWCHSGGAVAGACGHHRQATLPRIVADDCVASGDPVVFVREDGPRSASAPYAEGTVVIARFALPPPPAGHLSAGAPSGPLFELRSSVYALRI